jgi:hypothetical protein
LHNRDRRKILNIFIAQQFGIIFDVCPDETNVRMLLAQCFEFWSVGFAGIAPGRTKTQDDRKPGPLKGSGKCWRVWKKHVFGSAKYQVCL